MMIFWWSGGITSAVACKKALESYDRGLIKIVYIETGSHHHDTMRFKQDCESWYDKEIETIQNEKFKDHFDVISKDRYINGPTGARCTMLLKRRIRERFEKQNNISHYVWGFEYGVKEQDRASRIKMSIPNYKHLFPLIEHKLTKQDCINLVQKEGIKIPEMYLLGFHNNNCIGCVKGGMSYWNQIRRHFPEVFDKMANVERNLGRSCLKKYFLDELPIDAGRNSPPLVMDCGATGEGCITELSRQFHNRE